MTVGKGDGNMNFIEPLISHKSPPITAGVPAQPFNNLDLGPSSSSSAANMSSNMMGNGNVGNGNDYSNDDTMQWLNNLFTEEDNQMQQQNNQQANANGNASLNYESVNPNYRDHPHAVTNVIDRTPFPAVGIRSNSLNFQKYDKAPDGSPTGRSASKASNGLRGLVPSAPPSNIMPRPPPNNPTPRSHSKSTLSDVLPPPPKDLKVVPDFQTASR